MKKDYNGIVKYKTILRGFVHNKNTIMIKRTFQFKDKKHKIKEKDH